METSADDSSPRGRRVHGCWPDDQFAFQNNVPRQEINARPPAEYTWTASDTVASLAVMLDNSPTLLDPLKRLPAEAADDPPAFHFGATWLDALLPALHDRAFIRLYPISARQDGEL